MEPVVNKLQEGVKYPRFERDATKTINDLVEHITKERGVYSSSIEPNPNEHNIWFNTNDNTLYIYNKGVWKTINNDNNIDILNEPIAFYCSKGKLYYTGDNVSSGNSGIDISGFYNRERLKYIIEDCEGKKMANITINNIFIEPNDNATIIIGEDNSLTDITMVGAELNNANIHIYNNKLHIGNLGDAVADSEGFGINWIDITVYCNRKHIGDITITHINSDLVLYISLINFIVGNNNTLKIEQNVTNNMNECNIYVIKETDNDKSGVYLPNTISGELKEYINLCGTKLTGDGAAEINCNTYITTAIDDIDRNNSFDSPINMEICNIFIIDASYREFTYTGYLEYLRDYCKNIKVYVTDTQLFNFLKSQGLTPIMAIANNSYYDDKVIVNYKTTDGTDIYNKTIYKH